MKAYFKNLKVKQLLTLSALAFVLAQGQMAYAIVMRNPNEVSPQALQKKTKPMAQAQESAKKAASADQKSMASADEASINFSEWENDFNDSLKDVRTKSCKGKNCNFKDMQALDPSFEF